MAGGLISNGEAADARRPLWLAGLAGLLTASALVWTVALAWFAYDNARRDAGDAFEADGMVRPPAAFSGDWWADAALAFPKIAVVMLFYAVPLTGVIASLERGSYDRIAAVAGAAAMMPLVLALLVLAGLSPNVAFWAELAAPILLLLIIGAIGGAAATAVRNGRCE
jgi:hypothetical protein